MATIDLGRIKFKWQGAYNGATAYVVDDVVESGGSAYVCIAATTGNTPPNATYWELMASKGTDTSVLTTQGDVLYHDGTSLARLGAGTSGQYLQTQGSGANPQWNTVTTNVLGIYQAVNNTRNSFGGQTTAVVNYWTGTVNRTNASSNMWVQFNISRYDSVNHPWIGDFITLNTTEKWVQAHQGSLSTGQGGNDTFGMVFTAAELGATTGSINWKIGWNKGNTGTSVHIGTIWNPNQTDDGRNNGQSASLVTITEYL